MKKLLILGMALVLAVGLASCDGDDDVVFISGPGFAGIDDSTANAPLLIVNYTVPPSPTVLTANISSDLASDGDIAFDPVLNTFTVTSPPPAISPVVLFGFDSADPDFSEYRGFLTFPLDGATGMDNVPGTAVIVSATLDMIIDRVDFASVVPTFIDLVEYPFRGLSAADFNAPLVTPTSFGFVEFLLGDRRVLIPVTSLMQVAQAQGLFDFQVRFVVDAAGTLAASRGPARELGRTAYPLPRTIDNAVPSRGTRETAAPPEPGTRRR